MKRLILLAVVVAILPGCIIFTPRGRDHHGSGDGVRELPERGYEKGMKKGD